MTGKLAWEILYRRSGLQILKCFRTWKTILPLMFWRVWDTVSYAPLGPFPLKCWHPLQRIEILLIFSDFLACFFMFKSCRKFIMKRIHEAHLLDTTPRAWTWSNCLASRQKSVTSQEKIQIATKKEAYSWPRNKFMNFFVGYTSNVMQLNIPLLADATWGNHKRQYILEYLHL